MAETDNGFSYGGGGEGHMNLTLTFPNATKETSPETSESWFMNLELYQQLWIVVGPMIFFPGIIGNCLILAVMSRKRFKGTSTNVYLRAMAIADIIALIFGIIPEFFEAYSDDLIFKKIHPATCKLEKFGFYTSADASIWILVAFTIDRFIAIVFPLEKLTCCMPKWSKIHCLWVLLLAVVKNFHVFWTRGYEAEYGLNEFNETVIVWSSNCGRPTPEYKYFEKYVRPWIVFAVVNVIPCLVIGLCNIKICLALRKVTQMHKAQMVESSSKKTLIQMTTMCLAASFAFLICITPSLVLVIGRPQWQDNPGYKVAKPIVNLLVYINHSINFFLYCLTGQRFRDQLRYMVCCFGNLKEKSRSTNSLDSEGSRYMSHISRLNRRGSRTPSMRGSPAISRSHSRDIYKPSPMNTRKGPSPLTNGNDKNNIYLAVCSDNNKSDTNGDTYDTSVTTV